MPESIRFHLDENVDHAVADGLQRYGVDVTITSEVDLLHATDDVQLVFARGNTRVMVTHEMIFWYCTARGCLMLALPIVPRTPTLSGISFKRCYSSGASWNPTR